MWRYKLLLDPQLINGAPAPGLLEPCSGLLVTQPRRVCRSQNDTEEIQVLRWQPIHGDVLMTLHGAHAVSLSCVPRASCVSLEWLWEAREEAQTCISRVVVICSFSRMKAQAALNLALTLVLPSEPGSPAAFQGIALGEILPVPKAAFGCGSHSAQWTLSCLCLDS